MQKIKSFILRKLTDTGTAGWAQSVGLLVIRLGFGSMMLFGHGWMKWMNYSLMSASFPDPVGVGNATSMLLAVFAEVICSLMVIAGLFTRVAVLPLIFTMLIAFFVVHSADPFTVKELAMVYLLVYTSLLFTGPGRFSADYYLHRKLNKQ